MPSYELSDALNRLRALGAEAAREVDAIEDLLRDCWIDSYNRSCLAPLGRYDTCRCALGQEWRPFHDWLRDAE